MKSPKQEEESEEEQEAQLKRWFDAARDGCGEVVAHLLKENPELASELDYSHGYPARDALFRAAENGHLKVVELLLATSPSLFKEETRSGYYDALCSAVERGDSELMELLLKQKNLELSAEKISQLFEAASGHSATMLTRLLAARPDLIHVVDTKASQNVLQRAVRNGYFKVVELILAVSPDQACAVDKEGRTVLHLAARYHEIVALLLKEKPELITAVDKEGMTALHHACAAYGNGEDAARVLLAANPDLINAVDKQGRTALHYSCVEDNGEATTRLLLAANPGLINIGDKEGKTVLHYACVENDKKMDLLLTTNPELIHAKDSSGMTPLFRAVAADHPRGVARLLAADPEAIHKVDSQGRTILHFAAKKNCVQVVEQLLELSPQLLKAVDCKGRTAFDVASWESNSKVQTSAKARIVLADPSSWSQACCNGETILNYAVRQKCTKEVAKLLAQDPELINAIDEEDGTNVLHTAAEDGSEEVMEVLLAAASPELLKSTHKTTGRTLLHFAARNSEYPYVMDQLLDVLSPEVIQAADNQGTTVLHLATQSGMNKTVDRRILPRHADLIEKANSEGVTPLHMAVNGGDVCLAHSFLRLRPEAIFAIDNQGNTVLHYAIPAYKGDYFERNLKELVDLNPDARDALNCDNHTPFDFAVLRDNEFAIGLMLMRLSFDEVVESYECFEKNFQKRLGPVIDAQCECLLTLLNKDVVGIVYECLGLDDTIDRRPARKRKLPSDPCAVVAGDDDSSDSS